MARSKILNPNDGPNLDDFPVEILSQIFVHYLPKHPSPESVSAPLVLSGVSPQWRHIATLLPYIWAYLYIDIAKYTNNPDNLIRLGDLWIDRSHQRPIHVFIQGEANTNIINPFLHKFSTKFQSLSMTLSNYADPLAPMGFGHKWQNIDFQALKTLELDISGQLSIPPLTPNLRKLRIKHLPPAIYANLWAKFTHLDVTLELDQSLILTVLSMCPKLIEGEFRIKRYSYRNTQVWPVHPQLKRLILHSTSMYRMRSLPLELVASLEDLWLLSYMDLPEDRDFGSSRYHRPVCAAAVKQLTLDLLCIAAGLNHGHFDLAMASY